MLKKALSGVQAGIMISIGGAVFLACDNKYVGAALFTVALLTICIRGYSLYTGKIGFIPEKHDKEAFSVLLLGLLGNRVSDPFRSARARRNGACDLYEKAGPDLCADTDPRLLLRRADVRCGERVARP